PQWAFVALGAGTTGELLAGPKFFPPPEAAPPAGEPITVHIGIASSPVHEDRPLRLFFIQSFLGARRRIWVTTPYFVPDAATRDTLIARARDGVDVRLLMPGSHTDAKLIRLASHRNYSELLQAG